MTEFPIAILEGNAITDWNFEEIKGQLSLILDEYRNIVYTDDTIKEAKEDKAKMAKAKKIIEDRRKEFKKKCLQPYDAVEPQIKELTDMLEEQRKIIDATVKDYEDRRKAEKKAEIKAYYDKKAGELGALADTVFSGIFQENWTNKSTPKAKYQEEIVTAIGQAKADMDRLRGLQTPFIDTVLEKYAQTLSYEEAAAKNTELLEASAQAGIAAGGTAAVSESSTVNASADDGTILKVYATPSQLTQITDFMKAIGVTYEIG